MKTTVCLALALLVFAPLARARIGETPEECAKRYGPVLLPGLLPDVGQYQKNGFKIGVMFKQGHAWLIDFHKLDGKIDESCVRALLATETSDGSTWRLGRRKETVCEFEDGNLTALWSYEGKDTDGLTIMYVDTHDKDRGAAKAAAGF